MSTKKLCTIIGTALCLFLGSCDHGVKEDTAMAAGEARDVTSFIEGCGSQPVSGYTYCRVTEGDAAGQKLYLKVPPSACDQEQCVFWRIFYPSGEPALGGAVKRGETTVEINWKDLIKKDKFELGDRGYWGVLVEVHYVNMDGNPRKSLVEGEIRLRVLKRGYLSLKDIREDPNFVWSWTEKEKIYKMTTGSRAYVGDSK